MKLSEARIGKLDQGSIFTCARAERYRDQPVYGLVITARCDIDQEKFPVLNYIPIVTLDDWLMIDGLDIIRERAEKESYGKIRGFLKSKEVSESVLISQSLRSLASTTFSDLKAKDKTKFEELVTLFELATEGYASNAWTFFSAFDNLKSAVIEELVRHKLAGYYFLPCVYPNDQCHGYVALLREATFVPRNLASFIARGVDKHTIESDHLAGTSNCLNFTVDDFSMPISQIPSPEIEHILQSFSMMFGRIGLDDPDPGLINDLRTRVPERARAAQ